MSAESCPSVSVVTATIGRPANLRALVPSVLSDPWVRHFVVVVDGDEPETIAMLDKMASSEPRLVVGRVPGLGQLHALDQGAAMTDADVLLLLDDDVLPMPGLAKAHADRHRCRDDLVVAGSMPVEVPARGAHIGTLLYASDYGSYIESLEAGEFDVLDRLWMGNISIRRQRCIEIGLTSGEFAAWYHSDRDLGLRLADAGLVGVYDATLRAVHRHRRSDRAVLAVAEHRARALALLHSVHPALGTFDGTCFSQDLPRGLRELVRVLGRGSIARPISRSLLFGAALTGKMGLCATRLALGRLARRLMLVRGSNAAGRSPAADLDSALLKA
ncbi:MAG: glycosyltransferase family 2 protein [Acidimicrobiales bacterium]